MIKESEKKDARPFYFRGLAKLRLGNRKGAQQDLQRGARVEVTSDEPVFDINRSLLRVQGADRIMVEGYRTGARKEKAARELRMRQARYERMKRAEAEVLFNPDRKIPEVDLPLNVSAADPSSDPFLSGRAFESGDAEAPKPEISETPDIFGESNPGPMNPEGPPAQVDPFGGQPAAPPAQPANKVDPFGNAPATPPNTPPQQRGNPIDPFGNAPATPPQGGDQGEPLGGGQPPAGFPGAPAGGLKETLGGLTSAAANLIGNLNKDASRDPFGEDTTPKPPAGFGFPPGGPQGGGPQGPQGGGPGAPQGDGPQPPPGNPAAGQGAKQGADPFDPFKQ